MNAIIRKGNRWAWLMRYWILDKYREQLRFAAMWASAAIAIGAAVGLGLAVHWMMSEPVPQRAVAPVVIQLIIMAVSALISYAMRPKVEQVKPQEGSIPTTEEGKAVVRIYGDNWIDDSVVLAWKQLGTEPIKSGGKKWSPGLLPGTTNPIESWLDDKWNVSGLADVDDPIGGGSHDDED